MTIYRQYHTESSNLKVTGYNTDTKVMRILFRSGYLYYFYNVPKSIYTYIAEGAPKGGKRFWARLAMNYPYRQINRGNSINN